MQRHLQLETDLFCHGCGYNLHGQIVTMDERLGFLVCRCPECGRFHPAAMGVSATRPWLARLGVLLASMMLFTALGVFGLAGLFLGMASYAHLDSYTQRVYQNNSYGSNSIRELRVPNPSEYGTSYYQELLTRWRLFAGFSALVAVGLGMFCAVILWHASPVRRWAVLVFPFVVAVLTYGTWALNENIDHVFTYSVERLFAYSLLNVICMIFGLLSGRAITRGLLRLFVPPRLRQHVNFLWLCDGKTPPTVKA